MTLKQSWKSFEINYRIRFFQYNDLARATNRFQEHLSKQKQRNGIIPAYNEIIFLQEHYHYTASTNWCADLSRDWEDLESSRKDPYALPAQAAAASAG